tara:strand:+ start:884 stop:1285 length:402 start_codon:yes stop_codon:yes gene_type:complete
MRTQLLCTFTTVSRLSITVDNIVDVYDVMYGKMFVLENVNSEEELVCTYNIEAGNSTNKIPNTISLHRKKHTNTIYTINALNETIKIHNNGVLDKTFQLDWDIYRDCILLTNDKGLNRIDTAIKEIIRIKTKN